MRLLGQFKLFIFFFYEKILHAQKEQKEQKAQKALKALKALKAQKSIKINKGHKDTQAKAQNANKRISDYFPLRCF